MATSITADAQFAPDSSLEEDGFELLVPPQEESRSRARPSFFEPGCDGFNL
jgi:hypothetical protein